MTTHTHTRREREDYYRARGWWDDERIGDLLPSRAHRWPDRELFSFGDTRVSYREFDSWVSAVAADLVRHGVQRGDRVMVQLPNCLEALVLQVAAFRIGAVDMPLVPIYREHEVRQIIADSRPSVIAVSSELGQRRPTDEIDGILAALDHTVRVKYAVGESRAGWERVPGPDTAATATLPEPLAADETALLLYTSGTTSAPKGALLTSRALLAHLRSFSGVLGLDETTVTVGGTPLSHLAGFVGGLLLPAFLGGRSVILPAWKPDEAVQVIERERATLMLGATVFVNDLVQRYEGGAAPDHRLPTFACSGAVIPPAVVVRADAVGVRVMRVYGMTETGGTCTAALPDADLERRSQWDGKLLPGMEIQVVDEDLRPLPPGREGSLRIRGPQLLTGYTDPDLTAQQIDPDGWFNAGDVGVVDAEGWVRMTGRTKDIVNRGGEKLSTMDIEMAISSHPDVAAVAVTAVPDERLGEAVGAWVVLAPGARWTGPDTVIAHLEACRLARQKLPVEWYVVENLPATASGKIQKHLLRRDVETPDSGDGARRPPATSDVA